MYVTITQVEMYNIMLEFLWVLYGLYHRPKVDGQNVMYMNLKWDISGASLECRWGECGGIFWHLWMFFYHKKCIAYQVWKYNNV